MGKGQKGIRVSRDRAVLVVDIMETAVVEAISPSKPITTATGRITEQTELV